MTQHTCDINNILIQPYLSDTVVWFQTTAMKHCCCDSVTKSCPNLCDPMNCSMPLQSPRVCSNPCPSSQYYLTISSSVIPLSFCCQSSPASGSFPMSQFLSSGVQSTGASPSTSVLPMNIQGWFPLDWLVWSPRCPRDFQKSSPAPQFNRVSSSELRLVYGPALTYIQDYWKKANLWLQGPLLAKWNLCFLICCLGLL